MSNESIKLPSSLPKMVSSELKNLSIHKQEVFLEEYSRRSKSMLVAYLFWFFFGFHYLYFGKLGTQFVFWITGGGLFIWWFIDLFRIPGLINDHNKTVAIEVMMNLKTITRKDN